MYRSHCILGRQIFLSPSGQHSGAPTRRTPATSFPCPVLKAFIITSIEPKSIRRGRNWFVATSLALALVTLCTVIFLGCAASDGDEPTADDPAATTVADPMQPATPSSPTSEPDMTPTEPTVEATATVALPTQTATPSSPPVPDIRADTPTDETGDQDFVTLFTVSDPAAAGWVEDSLPVNSTRDWRPAPLGVGVTYLEGVFARVFAIEHMSVPCTYSPIESEPNDGCLIVVLQVITDPVPHPSDVHGNHDVSFSIDGEEPALYSWRNDYASEITDSAVGTLYAHDVPVKEGWSEAVMVYYPLPWEPIVFFSLTEKDYSSASDPLYGEALVRYQEAANTDKPGLLERLNELGLDDAAITSQDLDAPSPIHLVLTCAQYVALPAATPEKEVLAMAKLVSETEAGQAAPGYFVELEDAAALCGTLIPNSSKPLILLMLATSATVVCIYGDAGAFGANVSDVMLAGEMLFAFWGPESPVGISDFEDGEELCGWLLDPENSALKELLNSIDPELFGGS